MGWLRTTGTNLARRIAMRPAPSSSTRPRWSGRSRRSRTTRHDRAAERTRRDAFEEAVEQLSHREQRLVSLLVDERGLSYGVIGGLLERPIGSIGPSRARVVDKIRRQPVVKALLDADRDGRLAS